MQAFREYRRALGLPQEPQRAETYGLLILSPLNEHTQSRQAKQSPTVGHVHQNTQLGGHRVIGVTWGFAG
jgi:hypothetical protein